MKEILTPLDESKIIFNLIFIFYFLCGVVILINKNIQPTEIAGATFILIALVGIITTYKIGGENGQQRKISRSSKNS